MAKWNHASDTIHFNPSYLLDTLIIRMNLPGDGALAKKLKVAKPVIDKIRRGEIPVSGSIMLCMEEAAGINIDELRALVGDRRTTCRLSYPIKKDD